MKVYFGFSFAQDSEFDSFSENGIVETDELDAAGIEWEWNDGPDGPSMAGKEGLPTISKIGYGQRESE